MGVLFIKPPPTVLALSVCPTGSESTSPKLKDEAQISVITPSSGLASEGHGPERPPGDDARTCGQRAKRGRFIAVPTIGNIIEQNRTERRPQGTLRLLGDRA